MAIGTLRQGLEFEPGNPGLNAALEELYRIKNGEWFVFEMFLSLRLCCKRISVSMIVLNVLVPWGCAGGGAAEVTPGQEGESSTAAAAATDTAMVEVMEGGWVRLPCGALAHCREIYVYQCVLPCRV